MNNNTMVPYIISQFGYHVPAFVVYMVAFVLSLVFMRRALIPSILTLLGIAVLVIATFAVIGAQAYLLQNRGQGWLTTVAFIGNCARAIGLSLLIAAQRGSRRIV